MVALGFGICLGISVFVTILMAIRNYEAIDSCYWTLALLFPLLILCYWLKVQVKTPEAALILFIMINSFSMVLLVVLLLSMMRDLGIRIPPWVKALLYGAVIVHFGLVWFSLQGKKAEEIIRVTNTGEGYATRMQAGEFSYVTYGYILVMIIGMIGITAIILRRKKTSSRRTLIIYLILVGSGVLIYTGETVMDADFSGMPILYMIASLILAINYDHACTHDASRLAADYQKFHASRGYLAVDLSGRFLSCSEQCFRFLPDLEDQRVDSRFPADSELNVLIYGMLEDFRENARDKASFRSEGIICGCDIAYFSTRPEENPKGYIIEIRDATREFEDIRKLEDYNERLNREVAEKTQDIEDIQHKIVLGMADMIENRDSNTGGHVRRTSDVVAILVSEIQKQNRIPLSEELARNTVRAAPMHDLGKISIDSGILNKPARLTQEEYAIMKTHSTISGQMVNILLNGVEEGSFVRTAYQVARYHHERWDGKGYPEGLVGNMIPLEARIMAVADVYDALVSKRVYKEPMSYEKASIIMQEGMGTQFDPHMRSVFLGCRKKLEDYYDEANAR